MKEINEQEFLWLYNLGKKDTEIAKELGVGRKLVGRFRKNLNLPNYKEYSIIHNPEFVSKVKSLAGTMSDTDIAKELNVNLYYIQKVRVLNNLPSFDYRKIKEEEEEIILDLYNQGKMDSEISKIIGVNRATIQWYRKTHNLPTKFTYDKVSKIDNNKFEELFNEGLSDYTIAKELNMSPNGIYSHRMRHGYLREANLRLNTSIEMTDFQKQVLIGTVLGDSSFKLGEGCVSPSVSCAHGIKQKEYCEYKTEIFKSLGSKCSYHKRNTVDERTGIYYEDYTMFIPANTEFLSYYREFYPNGKKVIPINLLDQFTEVSLAFMFMDDGCKNESGYNIATNCFERENIAQFQEFLLSKFSINTSICANNSLYIKANSRNLFTYLISPYIIDCLKYKLHSLVTP